MTTTRELISQDGRYRALVERRADGNFEVSLWKWTREVVPGAGEGSEPFWSIVGRGVTLTDTFENAEKLAREKLADVSGPALDGA